MYKHLAITVAVALTSAFLQPSSARAQAFLGRNAADWEQALKEGKEARARRNAAFALGKLGKSSAGTVGTLEKCLRDDADASVREAAAFALGEIGRESLRVLDDPDVMETLAAALKDKDALVRRSAACALGNFGTSAKAVRTKLEAAFEDQSVPVRQNVAWALGRVGPETLPTLRKALLDRDNLVRRDAAGSVGQLEPAAAKGALPELLACCQVANSEVRLAALSVLVKIVDPDDKKAAAAIRPALEDPDLEVKQNAALALANIGGPESAPAIPILLDTLKQGDIDLKRQAAAAIANIGPDAASAVPTLLEYLNTMDPEFKRNIVVALGGIGPKAEVAVPAVARLVADPLENKDVRIQAAVTMNRFGSGDAARKTVPSLLRVLEDPTDDPAVRWRVTWALRVYKDALTEIPGVLPAFVKVVREQPRKETKMLRYDCAYLLGMLQAEKTPKEALDVLLEFLKDNEVILYEKTKVQTSGGSTETNKGQASVNEEGKGDARVMAIAALTEIGPEIVSRRTDIVRQLRAIVANPDTIPDLKMKTKALLDRLK